MTVTLKALVAKANALLEPEQFQDYCPNGLQVQGASNVAVLVSGVTASQALIDRAVELNADAVIVHHGYFWKGEDPCVVGIKQQRLKTLLENNISLLAYHLPLDAHPELGNNTQLAKLLGVEITGGLQRGQSRPVGNVGRLPGPMPVEQFVRQVAIKLGREPMWIAGGAEIIETLAWCTGAAQSYIGDAVEQGVDLFLSGEISEPTVHVARESAVHYVAAGHHATERYGIKALAEKLAQHFELDHHFVDIDNPV
mgnify:FL=1